jgi:hypothetical protein
MAIDASATSSTTAAIPLDVVPPEPSESWALSTLMEDDHLEMEAHGLLSEKVISG